MARPYSKEFRGEVLSACDSGKGTREVALLFDVSESWVRRVKQERRELGKTAPLLKRNRSSKWAKYSDQIMAIYAARPDTTLAELKEELGTTLSRSTLCIALRKLKLTYKKKSSSRQSKSVKTSQSSVAGGNEDNVRLIQTVSSSSMKHGPRRT